VIQRIQLRHRKLEPGAKTARKVGLAVPADPDDDDAARAHRIAKLGFASSII
jgi:hypothetical protein